MIIDVIGIKMEPRSFLIWISPGNFPNQFKAHGAKCKIAPSANKSAPIIIIHLAISTLSYKFYRTVIMLNVKNLAHA